MHELLKVKTPDYQSYVLVVWKMMLPKSTLLHSIDLQDFAIWESACWISVQNAFRSWQKWLIAYSCKARGVYTKKCGFENMKAI